MVSSFFRRRPLVAIFGLPQYGHRSGGLTGEEGGGDLSARLNMRVVIAQVVRRVTNLQKRIWVMWFRRR
jgi:hypothetical protein